MRIRAGAVWIRAGVGGTPSAYRPSRVALPDIPVSARRVVAPGTARFLGMFTSGSPEGRTPLTAYS
ncbi:hypothetical protein GCM10022225_52370 [Plantactinospora mayteni]|uniref:Uncharacterized protein n=1 Tax=Plantactinospora mayteni TaxID=566021 RepID=A0ABQ4EYX6_9ACTN|nr:hypothetical protein [Plantactinospora mayteni]GIG99846.1 hypothetical protein Pma05_64190 [Plantactinospora mayteni]